MTRTTAKTTTPSAPVVSGTVVDGPREYTVHYDTPGHDAMLRWLAVHGIDPMRLPRGSRIVRDEDAQVIRYTRFAVDLMNSSVPVASLLDANGEVIVEAVTDHCSVAPLPFPTVITGVH